MLDAVDFSAVCRAAQEFHQYEPEHEYALQTVSNKDLHTEIRRLSIIQWYHALRIRADLTTAYSMQRRFQPESFIRLPGLPEYHSNKWRIYRDGQSKPSAARIARVERLYPGSSLEMDRMLWEVFDVERPIGRRAGWLLRRLEPTVQQAIFCTKQHPKSGNTRKSSPRLIAASIQDIANLDSLAALILFTRESIEQGNGTDAHFWATQTYYMLLKLGVELHRRGVGYPIIRLYHELILSRVYSDGCRFHDSIGDIVEASIQLSLLVYEIKNVKGDALNWNDRVKLMSRLIKGKFGWDVFFALRPRWGPVNKEENRQCQKYEQQERLRQWGWSSVLGKIPQSNWPPDKVFIGENP